MKKNIFIISTVFAFAFSAITSQASQWEWPNKGTAAALGTAAVTLGGLGAYYGRQKYRQGVKQKKKFKGFRIKGESLPMVVEAAQEPFFREGDHTPNKNYTLIEDLYKMIDKLSKKQFFALEEQLAKFKGNLRQQGSDIVDVP